MSTRPTELLCHLTLVLLPLPRAALIHTALTMMDTALALFTPVELSVSRTSEPRLTVNVGIAFVNGYLDANNSVNRFTGVRIEDLQGELLNLCKDQHGCRYLQKKLEDGEPAHRDMIFRETYGHFPELMTDPFGNYLCQKLLEYSTDEQRTAIIESVANDLVGISLNMHGTRAVQKMVDFLASPRQPKQIRTLIYALSMNVVALIKDLNGNHVGVYSFVKYIMA